MRVELSVASNLALWQLNGRELAFFLHALIQQAPDSKNELGKKDDGDNVPLILAILRTIKGYESARPELKSEVSMNFCRHSKAHNWCPCVSSIHSFMPLWQL